MNLKYIAVVAALCASHSIIAYWGSSESHAPQSNLIANGTRSRTDVRRISEERRFQASELIREGIARLPDRDKSFSSVPSFDLYKKNLQFFQSEKDRIGEVANPEEAVKALSKENSVGEQAAYLSKWFDSDAASAMSYVESEGLALSSSAIEGACAIFLIEHGPEGFKGLIQGANKCEPQLARVLLENDPILAFEMRELFASNSQRDLISRQAFQWWPLDRRKEALDTMVSSLGDKDFVTAFNGIGSRLEGYELIEWMDFSVSAKGLTQACREALLRSKAYREAYVVADNLPFNERLEGVVERHNVESTDSEMASLESARLIIEHDLDVGMSDIAHMITLFEDGELSFQETLMSISGLHREAYEAFPEVFQAEVFERLLPMNPEDAAELLDPLSDPVNQESLLNAATKLSSSQYTIDEIVSICELLPDTMAEAVQGKRDNLLGGWVRSAERSHGNRALNKWLSSRPESDVTRKIKDLLEERAK